MAADSGCETVTVRLPTQLVAEMDGVCLHQGYPTRDAFVEAALDNRSK